MKERKALVVGAGAGGLTLALLLAKTGRKVTLIESQPEIGGYLRRFTRDGMRFDTGYHFSGGFTNIMPQMMRVLGMDDLVRAEAIDNRIVLKESGDDITVAANSGHKGAEDTFCRALPKDAAAVRNFGLCLKKIGRTELAEKVLGRAEELMKAASAKGSEVTAE